MRKFLVVFCVLAVVSSTALKGYQQTLDAMTKTEVGKSLIQEMKAKLSIDANKVDAVASFLIFLTSLEKSVLEDEQNELAALKDIKDKYGSNISDLKSESQKNYYDQQKCEDEIKNLNGDIEKYQKSIEEKKYTSAQQTKSFESLQKVRDEQAERYETQKDQIFNTLEIIKRSKFLISEVIPRPRESSMAQISESSLGELKEFNLKIVKENNQNPFVTLIQTFTETLTSKPVNKEQAESIIKTLSQIQDDLIDTSNSFYNAEQQRQAAFAELQTRSEDNLQKWQQEIADLESAIENTNSKILSLDNEKSSYTSKLESQQKQIDDMKTMIEDAQVKYYDYNDRKKQREEYQKYLKQLRQIVQEDFLGATKYVEQIRI